MADDVVKDRQCWTCAPYFIVDDVVSTANYYRDKLGFHYERFWNDPPSFCMVKRNGVVIMLAQLETAGAMGELPTAYARSVRRRCSPRLFAAAAPRNPLRRRHPQPR